MLGLASRLKKTILCPLSERVSPMSKNPDGPSLPACEGNACSSESWRPVALEHIGDDKLKHMCSVAELMYSRALALKGDLAFAEDMYLLGFVHDLGYFIQGPGHPAAGASILERCGYCYSDHVRHHGDGDLPDCFGDKNDNSRFAMNLLQWCDMSVMPDGTIVDMDTRLSDIEHRYGRSSKAFESAVEIAERLRLVFVDDPSKL